MKHLLLVLLAVLSALTLSAEERIGTVNATTLNVRNRPDAVTSTVVAQLKSGDKVTILKESGQWYEIAAPANTRVYVSSEFLKDGKTTREVNLRSGASVNHQSYGIVPADTVLEATEAPRGGWVRIKPLPTITCFASSKYISVSGEDTAKTALPNEAKPATAGQSKATPAAKGVSEEYTKNLNTLRASYINGSAKSIDISCKLLELKSSNSNSPIRYVLEYNNKRFWVVDVKPEAVKDYINRVIKVSGVSYEVRGWKNPVLEITQISQ